MITKREVKDFIQTVLELRESLTNEQAIEMIKIYPKWKENKEYEKEERIVYEDQLYLVKEAHTSSLENLPNNSKILYTLLS